MNSRLVNIPVVISSIISVVGIIFLNIFGSTVFGVDEVQDYRKGNRARQLSTVKFELFILPFSVFTYSRLIQFAKNLLICNNNGLLTDRTAKYLKLIIISTMLWLFMGHATLFLYFIPGLVPRFFIVLCFLSIGLWYHIVIPLIIFTILTLVISGLNVGSGFICYSFCVVDKFHHSIIGCNSEFIPLMVHLLVRTVTICHPFIRKCFYKFPAVEALCLNKNVQVTFTLLVATFLCLLSCLFSDTFTIKHLSVDVKDLPVDAEGIRFALISDIHAGATVFEEQIERIVDRVNSQRVDGVFIVGDVVDAPRDAIEDRLKPLRFLKSKVFYVSGNHEYYYGNASEWFDLFGQFGFEVLNNRHVDFRGICVAGVSDYSSGKSGLPNHMFEPLKALKGCSQDSATIVLSHNPSSAKEIAFNDARLRVDLILSGHTHAGQFYTVAPIAYWMLPYYYGLYEISTETKLFVTAGTLYQGAPMKMIWLSEIWIIELHHA